MPKLSKATAAHQVFPGFADTYEQDVGEWNVSIESYSTDMDMAPFFKGAPDDQCQASHVGYVLRGRFGVRNADGSEEIYEAGEAFVIAPGHTPIAFEGCEFVAFTPAEEAKQQTAVMMPNILKFAEAHGVEIPGEVSAS